jgi:hypothetical protein
MHEIWNDANLILWENLSWIMRGFQERILTENATELY